MKAAFGKISLVPPLRIQETKNGKFRVPMAGYTRHHYAEGAMDDIMARAVLIEDVVLGNINKKMLLISLDFLKVPMLLTEYIKEKIQEKADFGIGPAQILIHGTHTHSAPDLTGEYYWPGETQNVIKGILFGANRSDRYLVWLTLQIVKMVKQMVLDLQPVKMAMKKSALDIDLSYNRRHLKKLPKNKLSVLSFISLKSNKIIGLVVNYASHGTSLGRNFRKLSAEWMGRVCHWIEKHYEDNTEGNYGKEPVSAVYFNGASGDLNPMGIHYSNVDELMEFPEEELVSRGQYRTTQKIGFFLGQRSLELADSIVQEEYFDTIQFQTYLKKIWIPFRDFKYKYGAHNWLSWLSNKVVIFVKKYILFPLALMHPEHQEPNFPGLAIKAYPFSIKKGYKVNVYTILQLISITLSDSKNPKKKRDLTIFGFPGELFDEIGKKFMKNCKNGPDNSLIIQCANDWVAYLFPWTEYITQAGYEPYASTSPIAGYRVEKEMFLLMKEIEEGVQLGYN
jgi:neutral/alkaline ceramidase-like enzyme